MEPFGTIAAGLLVSVATSVVTVRLALGRFYSERWWERRLDAYIRVHDALSVQLRQREVRVDDLYAFYAGEASNGPPPDDMAEEIRRSWRESERELENALARGAFLLSEDAVTLLRRYQRQQGELERTMQDLVEEQIEA
jgi:hypothetical protein